MRLLAIVLALSAACGNALDNSALEDALKPPQSLVAHGANKQIALKWKAVSGVKQYLVLRGAQAGGPYSKVATAASASFTDTALAPSTFYFYAVQSITAKGPSALSNEASARTAPGAVGLSQFAIGGKQASLAWSAVDGATDYVVSKIGSTGKLTAVQTTTLTSLTVTGVSASAVQYVVQARNESGPGDASSPAAGNGATPAVTGYNPDIYVTSTGEQLRIDSLEGYPVRAVSGGTSYDGLCTADGRFTIPGVPTGAYWLNFGGSTYYATSARFIDTGSPILGRPDVQYSEGGATISLSVSNLDNWTSGDWMQLYSQNAGVAALDVGDGFDPNQPPTAGSTSLSGYNLQLAAGTGLIDGSKGDTALVTQLHWQPLAGTQNGVQTITRAFAPQPFVLLDGQSIALSGAFDTVPQDRPLALSFKRSAFAGYLPAIGPGAASGWSYMKVFTGPELAEHGSFAGTPNVAYFNFDRGDADQSVSFNYGNPFPAEWDTFASVTYPVNVQFALPGLRAVNAQGTIAVADELGLMSSVTPRVSPPRSVQASGSTISWTKPAVGAPNLYTVNVWHLVPDGQGGTRTVRVQQLVTAGTSVTLPVALTQGETYYAYVKARIEPGNDSTKTPFHFASSWAVAGAFSSTFTP